MYMLHGTRSACNMHERGVNDIALGHFEKARQGSKRRRMGMHVTCSRDILTQI
jgi:hypothetical protein